MANEAFDSSYLPTTVATFRCEGYTYTSPVRTRVWSAQQFRGRREDGGGRGGSGRLRIGVAVRRDLASDV